MNGLRKCGIYTMEFIQPQRRMKICHLQVNGWNCRFRKTKAACSLSYVEYRPNTNTAIL
jgi:hypothetical protein